jgi:hypothetical protein
MRHADANPIESAIGWLATKRESPDDSERETAGENHAGSACETAALLARLGGGAGDAGLLAIGLAAPICSVRSGLRLWTR